MEVNRGNPLLRFFDDVAEVVEGGGSEGTVTANVAALMRRLLLLRPFLPSEFMRPREDHYAMYPLYVAPQSRFCVASAVWDVGQESPIHDHGTWGVIGIYQGLELERRYTAVSPSRPTAPVQEGARSWKTGEVTICCTTDQDIHSVRCGSAVPCVGIHVYGGDIGRIVRNAYDKNSGIKRPFISQWTHPRQDVAAAVALPTGRSGPRG